MQFKKSFYKVDVGIPNTKDHMIYSSRTSECIVLKEENYAHYANDDFDSLPTEFLDKLIDFELIVPSAENELKSIIDENEASVTESNVLYQVIQPSGNCQLGCGYCGQVHKKKNLPSSYDENLLKRIKFKLLANPQYNYLQLGWFGGEPLMGLQSMRRLTPKLKKLCEEHNLGYSSKVVTNGLSLKPKIFLELVKEHKVNSFEVTLDGVAEFHDKRRFVKSGEKSFDIIFQNLKDIFSLPEYDTLDVGISMRCNVDSSNFEGVTPLLEMLHANDMHKRLSGFYVAPIHSWGNEAHLVSLEKEEFATREIGWIIEQFKNGFSPTLLPPRKKEVCMVVDPNSELFDAFGNIFNCTEVSQVPVYENSEYLLGNLKFVDDTVQFQNKPFTDWNQTVLKGDKGYPCTTCNMLPVCGGSCPKSWKEGIVACPSSKHNIEDKLVLAYLIANKGLEIFKTPETVE